MAGVPRSNGCALCVKRRLKCDEARPACKRCEKYGSKCPGYNRNLKFVVGTPRRRRKTSSRDVAASHDDSSAEPSPSAPTNNTTNPVGNEASSCSKRLAEQISPVIQSPSLQDEQCLALVIADLSISDSTEVVLTSRWLSLIPERLSTSDALDTAVRCFAIHHLGITHGNEQMIRCARSTYGQALTSLQKALYNPVEVMSSQTLCATSILCMYELFVGTNPDSWIKHANGIGGLIQARGPDRHRNGLDNFIFTTFRGLIVAAALFGGKDCFLDGEEWRAVAMLHPNTNISREFSQLLDEFAGHLAAVPGLVRRVYALSASNSTQVSSLVLSTLHIYNHFQDWYDQCNQVIIQPDEVPSSFNDSLYPVVYRYSDVSTAMLVCSYYATIIILHNILKACHYDVDYDAETAKLRDKICMSVEYVYGTGIMGAYKLGYSIRVAFDESPPNTQIWIKGWLGKFAKVYAVVSPSTYPRVEGEI